MHVVVQRCSPDGWDPSYRVVSTNWWEWNGEKRAWAFSTILALLGARTERRNLPPATLFFFVLYEWQNAALNC